MKKQTKVRVALALAGALIFLGGLGLGAFLAVDNIRVLGVCRFTLPESFQVPDRN